MQKKEKVLPHGGDAPYKKEILLAGFGGQGVLFAGKVLTYCGLLAGKEVSWLPSYGPEMRGGTANCSVCISDDPIGSPLVTKPDLFICMNGPSFDKFIDSVVPGGTVFIDETLVTQEVSRTDVTVYSIPAAALAAENNLSGMSNMILLGKFFKESAEETEMFSMETVKGALEKCVPSTKTHLIEVNIRAIELGRKK
ncbi:MAG: 2-oxoacid:acceptor oxidoreductase family protein [Oscillospiraceae bacterium]|jgi:2-oxoglutarate ferredoxin oxidoreductase subunit gamma|nr:2-oxoacid:acceptor oxidoreductase family protein [Oscillospiraceae bacterium]